MRTLIIGAGLMGVTTAHFLRQHGMEVTVVEAAEGPALGASYANGGYLQSTAPDPWNAPGVFRLFWQAWANSLTGRGGKSAYVVRTTELPRLLRWGLRFIRNSHASVFRNHLLKNMELAQYTRQVFDSLETTMALSYDQSNRGALIIFREIASLKRYLDLISPVAQQGLPVQEISRDQLLDEEPALDPVGKQLVGAVYYPRDAGGDAREFCRQIARHNANVGVRFHFDTEVNAVSALGRGFRVRTSQGDFAADRVVIAAGARSNTLLGPLGIRPPIAPAKGYSISIPLPASTHRPTRVIVDMNVHAALTPLGSKLRVAGTAEFTGLRPGVSPERTNYLLDLARSVFPNLMAGVDPSLIEPWAGHRPLCADGLPIIGQSGIQGLYLNTGHGGLGWTQAAGSAKALADQIAGLKPQIDLTPFSIDRFH